MPLERRGLGVTSGIRATAGLLYTPIARSSSPRNTRNTGIGYRSMTTGIITIRTTAAAVPARIKGILRPIFVWHRSDRAPKNGNRNRASTLSIAITTPAQVSPR